jgi:hypothetical protein
MISGFYVVQAWRCLAMCTHVGLCRSVKVISNLVQRRLTRCVKSPQLCCGDYCSIQSPTLTLTFINWVGTCSKNRCAVMWASGCLQTLSLLVLLHIHPFSKSCQHDFFNDPIARSAALYRILELNGNSRYYDRNII